MQSIYDNFSLEYLGLFVTTAIAATFSGAVEMRFLSLHTCNAATSRVSMHACVLIELDSAPLFSKETESYMPLLYSSSSVVFKKMHFYWDSGFGK